mmetsp:Transcript_9887/g.19413  ORF Transcript_9887/g.19413 Transcript_9887/m.19413 type:complete len:111 (+) Transcript_9887:1937-2269(+)
MPAYICYIRCMSDSSNSLIVLVGRTQSSSKKFPRTTEVIRASPLEIASCSSMRWSSSSCCKAPLQFDSLQVNFGLFAYLLCLLFMEFVRELIELEESKAAQSQWLPSHDA